LAKFQFDLDALKRLARFAATRSREDRIPQVAGSLTFTTVLSLVPLATVAFALFTAFPIFASFQQSLQAFLADHLMPAQINSQIFRYLNQFAAKAKGLTTMGLIILAFTAVMTMMTVEAAFNGIWRVRKSRPFAQRILVYWAVLTLGPLLIGISLSMSSFLFTHSFLKHSPPPIFEWALTGGAILPLTVLAFSLLYMYVPNCRVEWRDALVGGLCAAIAFELAKRGFGSYVRRIPTYTAVYGAFATLPIFLLWIYLCWVITLLGAMIVSALPAIRLGYYHRFRFPGSDLLDALELLAHLYDAREASRPGYTLKDLALLQRNDLDTVTRVIGELERIEWVARLHKEGKPPHFMLLVNPLQAKLAVLFEIFAVNRTELAYQLNLDNARIDGAVLLPALSSEGLDVSLATLMAARGRAQSDNRPMQMSLNMTQSPAKL